MYKKSSVIITVELIQKVNMLTIRNKGMRGKLLIEPQLLTTSLNKEFRRSML